MKNILDFIAENWSTIIILICIIIVAVKGFVEFTKLPTEEQVKKVKECMLAWVIAAEKDLGGGTGKVKLSIVYGWFVVAFPMLKNFISMDTFDKWVDEALTTMNTMLESNQNLNKIVNGEEETTKSEEK